MSKWLIVGLDDGIILDVSRCVLVDESEIGDADERLLNFGTEVEGISVATRHGKKLFDILLSCGFGDLGYQNSVSFSPLVLRTEFSEVMTDDSELQEMFQWALTLTEEQLHLLAEMCLEFDELWSGWRFALITALQELRQHITQTKEKV